MFSKIDQVPLLPVQSCGAQNLLRIRNGARTSLEIAFPWTLPIVLVFELFPYQMFFLCSTWIAQVLYYGMLFLRTGVPFNLLRILNQVFAGAMREPGHALHPTAAMLLSFVVLRQYTLPPPPA